MIISNIKVFSTSYKMKIALIFLAMLPFVCSAHMVKERFIEALLGGYDSK